MVLIANLSEYSIFKELFNFSGSSCYFYKIFFKIRFEEQALTPVVLRSKNKKLFVM
jgi:hypothetical protein